MFNGDGPESGRDGYEWDSDLPKEESTHCKRREGGDETADTARIEAVQASQISEAEKGEQRKKEEKVGAPKLVPGRW